MKLLVRVIILIVYLINFWLYYLGILPYDPCEEGCIPIDVAYDMTFSHNVSWRGARIFSPIRKGCVSDVV